MTLYREATGQLLGLGKRIGQGGEGSVYSVPGSPGLVAKVYHVRPDVQRQRKLRLITSLGTPALMKVCAWPTRTLHDGDGQVVGVVMPRVDLSQARPIHDVTGPASRLQHFPDFDFAALVLVARNLAAAVATIHAHGQVVGDLNPNNVYVSRQGTVTLIDVDSFQVSAGGERHLCLVGMPEFTPPEVQGADLARTVRTANHDNFGLATFVFQLLFLGHSPWNGTYAHGPQLSVPEAIRQHHFAWGRAAARVGLAPPPLAPRLNALPTYVTELFEQAFGETHRRPEAARWVEALERLHAELGECLSNAGHTHHRDVPCPWCPLEQGSIRFFRAAPRARPRPARQDSADLWGPIERYAAPTVPSLAVPERELPLTASVVRARRVAAVLAVLAAGFAALAFSFSLGWFVVLLGLLLALTQGFKSARYRGRPGVLAQIGALDLQAEDLMREYERREAVAWQVEAVLAELRRAREALQASEQRLTVLKQAALEEHNAQRLARHLASHPIVVGTARGLNEKRLRTLHSRGIRTAQDIQHHRLLRVPGMSSRMARELDRWRSDLEANAQTRVQSLPVSVMKALEARIREEDARYMEILRHGPASLAGAAEYHQQEFAKVQAELEQLARQRSRLLDQL